MPISVKTDEMTQVKRHMRKQKAYMEKMMDGEGPEFKPVDFVGARADYNKDVNNPGKNLSKAQEDIQERFGLDVRGAEVNSSNPNNEDY